MVQASAGKRWQNTNTRPAWLLSDVWGWATAQHDTNLASKWCPGGERTPDSCWFTVVRFFRLHECSCEYPASKGLPKILRKEPSCKIRDLLEANYLTDARKSCISPATNMHSGPATCEHFMNYTCSCRFSALRVQWISGTLQWEAP